ncbi:hypothetical protein FOE78_13010 [Microlunatus elymi]|uniref:Uncharacterized protein n=1 Tax=Microlunatus elymi TaxID=2596828 RepID=A0A516PZU0_9ACTN|nr:DUF6325 family protein [Microlunatus elymi]QDP96705.1 hypothetical protein FOE78_13010 [Microlunatus elymi]
MTAPADADDQLGLLGFVAVRLSDADASLAGFRALLELVQQHRIRILDLEFVSKPATGSYRLVPAEELSLLGDVIAEFAGASSRLLDVEDLAEVADQLPPESLAAVLIYEDLGLHPALAAWQASGATLLSTGAVDVDDLVEVLDRET